MCVCVHTATCHSEVVSGSGCNQDSLTFSDSAPTLLTVRSGCAMLFCSAVTFGLDSVD